MIKRQALIHASADGALGNFFFLRGNTGPEKREIKFLFNQVHMDFFL